MIRFSSSARRALRFHCLYFVCEFHAIGTCAWICSQFAVDLTHLSSILFVSIILCAVPIDPHPAIIVLVFPFIQLCHIMFSRVHSFYRGAYSLYTGFGSCPLYPLYPRETTQPVKKARLRAHRQTRPQRPCQKKLTWRNK